ncbi:cytochrome P450 [Streptomyces sp. NPDC020681]|uniref:cytochrome P450 n=1 Tax=Streptomyces sp. NPDC020681 TaxID=3365083 RepID=UPI00378B8E9C
MLTVAPSSSADLFANHSYTDTNVLYCRLRRLGPVVRLQCHDAWAVPRLADVRAVLNDRVNFVREAPLVMPTADAGTRAARRKVNKALARHQGPRPTFTLGSDLAARADAIVSEHAPAGEFDAAELVRAFVTDTALRLLGVSADLRRDLSRTPGVFDCFGTDAERRRQALKAGAETLGLLQRAITHDKITPQSWLDVAFNSAAAAGLDESEAIPLAFAHAAAGLDATIYGITAAIDQFARNPLQWDLLRDNPGLAAGAFHEAVRVSSPIHHVTRVTSRPTSIDGTRLEEGERLWLLIRSAGLDRAAWGPYAERFNICRPDVAQHLALGTRIRSKAGRHIATSQAEAFLKALAVQCREIRPAGEPHPLRSTTLLGWSHMPLAVTACTPRPRPRPPLNGERPDREHSPLEESCAPNPGIC